VVEQLIGNVRQGWRSWFFSWNAVVFVHGHRLPDAIPRSPVQAAILLAAYSAAAAAIALAAFQTRDVT